MGQLPQIKALEECITLQYSAPRWEFHDPELLGPAHDFGRRKVANLSGSLGHVQYLVIHKTAFQDLPTIIEEVCQRCFYIEWMHASQPD